MTENNSIEGLARQLHDWYLEGTKSLDPENYNSKAQVSYDEMNEQQKEIDRYIARKVLNILTTTREEAVREERERADRIVRETMDSLELETNAEFIACDDFAIKLIKALTPPDTKVADKEKGV